MQRDAMNALLAWKDNPSRKPLMLFGARQVGKSYLLEEFAKKSYQSYALLNLEQSGNLRDAFEGELSQRQSSPISRNSRTCRCQRVTRSSC